MRTCESRGLVFVCQTHHLHPPTLTAHTGNTKYCALIHPAIFAHLSRKATCIEKRGRAGITWIQLNVNVRLITTSAYSKLDYIQLSHVIINKQEQPFGKDISADELVVTTLWTHVQGARDFFFFFLRSLTLNWHELPFGDGACYEASQKHHRHHQKPSTTQSSYVWENKTHWPWEKSDHLNTISVWCSGGSLVSHYPGNTARWERFTHILPKQPPTAEGRIRCNANIWLCLHHLCLV